MKRSQGAVLIITGPESAGKTTFVATVLARYSNWYTINRKKHLKDALRSPEIINEFLGDVIKDVEKISGQKIRYLSELNFEKIGHLDVTSKKILTELVGTAVSISMTPAFRERVLLKAYKGYYREIMPIVTAGGNVIIDDSTFIESPRIFTIFKEAMRGYPHVRLALLKNTLASTFANCQQRNRKYKEVASPLATYQEANEVAQKRELESGGSSSSFRLPKSILQNYHQLYYFKTSVNMNDIVVEILTRKNLQATITAIAIEHDAMVYFLRSKGFIVDDVTAEFDVATELQSIIANAPLVYVVCKSKPDYIVDGSLTLSKTQSMLREWGLAITAFGKLVIINGVASQAKVNGFNIINFDQTATTAIFQMDPKFQVLIFDIMWRQARVHLLRGENVIIPVVLSSGEQIDLLKQRFFGFKSAIITITPAYDRARRTHEASGIETSTLTSQISLADKSEVLPYNLSL
jgi:hypothetical protein